MQYLTYDEYTQLGGGGDESAFNRNIMRACGIINNETHNRVAKMEKVPDEVKYCIRDLIEFMNANNDGVSQTVSSKSQSVGGVSESYSYAVLSGEEEQDKISGIVYDYLLSVKFDNGEGLLYRGRGY